jgi:hypothetical protein
MVSDEAGNEVDLVPGGPMSDASETADWRAPFAAMVFYPTTAPEHASALVTTAAGLADDAGIPLLIGGTEPIPERASPTSTTRVGSTRCSSSRGWTARMMPGDANATGCGWN